jgi:HSP20 family protein
MANTQQTQEQTKTQEQANQAAATQGGQQRGLARRGYFPSLFSLSPSDFFTASPFELMRRFTEEMDQAFESSGLSRRSGAGQMATWSPAVDVFERDGNLVIHAELPGLNKDDVKVEMIDGALVIRGESKREHEEQRQGLYRCERSHGAFYRVIPLPEGANLDQARAQFKNGVLEVSIPVPQSQRNRREIPVEAGDSQQSQTVTGGQKKS